MKYFYAALASVPLGFFLMWPFSKLTGVGLMEGGFLFIWPFLSLLSFGALSVIFAYRASTDRSSS